MNLTKNVGETDSKIRLAVAGVLIIAAIVGGAWGTMSSIQAVLLTVVGLVLLATGFKRVCMAYSLFGIDTSKGDPN